MLLRGREGYIFNSLHLENKWAHNLVWWERGWEGSEMTIKVQSKLFKRRLGSRGDATTDKTVIKAREPHILYPITIN